MEQPPPATPQGDARGATDALAEWYQTSRLLAHGTRWTPLEGGRTNLTWKLEGGPRALVCKLHRANAATPLFPNSAEAEETALHHLAGTGLAPALVGSHATPFGTCLLMEFAAEPLCGNDPGEVAGLLRRLHETPPPRGLPVVRADPGTVTQSAMAMLDAAEPSIRALLMDAKPRVPRHVPSARRSFLHGDPVPGNFRRHRGRAVMIDWQCPSIGDPILDLALLLSPSMRLVNGLSPLSADRTREALDRYGDAEAAARLHRLRPLLTWRLACYSAWKTARGDGDYAAGMRAELALLESLEDRDARCHDETARDT